MSEIAGYLQARKGEMVDLLRTLVEHESPSNDKKALDGLGRLLERELEKTGATVEVVHRDAAGDHLVASWDLRHRGKEGQVLLLGHMDTVWQVGELARRPFRIEGARAYGPGAYDMKAGIVIGIYAMKALRELGIGTELRTVFILNSDEEVHSRTSRALIQEQSARSSYVLGLEPKYPSGTITTSRKSVSTLTLEVTGKASHAGAAPERGASAIHELAHQVLKLHQLTDMSRGTTVIAGIISGGTRANIVPAYARAVIDVRYALPEEGERVRKALAGLAPVTPGTSLRLVPGEERPLWARTAQSAALLKRAQAIAAGLGLNLREESSGGVSDANFAGATGIPTLDGLGADGDGAHAEDEYADLSTLVPTAALVAELVRSLE